jgi:hypothetical protein
MNELQLNIRVFGAFGFALMAAAMLRRRPRRPRIAELAAGISLTLAVPILMAAYFYIAGNYRVTPPLALPVGVAVVLLAALLRFWEPSGARSMMLVGYCCAAAALLSNYSTLMGRLGYIMPEELPFRCADRAWHTRITGLHITPQQACTVQ